MAIRKIDQTCWGGILRRVGGNLFAAGDSHFHVPRSNMGQAESLIGQQVWAWVEYRRSQWRLVQMQAHTMEAQ